MPTSLGYVGAPRTEGPRRVTLLACLDAVYPAPEKSSCGTAEVRTRRSVSAPARNSVAVTTVLDRGLQINVFLACGIAA